MKCIVQVFDEQASFNEKIVRRESVIAMKSTQGAQKNKTVDNYPSRNLLLHWTSNIYSFSIYYVFLYVGTVENFL